MNPYDASVTNIVLRVIAYVVLAPLAGGLLAGLDRKVSAWMQGRVGPPVVQPFYDVAKLLRKEKIAVNRFQNFFVFLFFLFMVFTGSLFFAGASILIVVFVLVLASLFFVLAGFSVNSPYSHLGAERELIQMMAYDPAIIILAIGLYVVTGSFNVGSIYHASQEVYLIIYLPGITILIYGWDGASWQVVLHWFRMAWDKLEACPTAVSNAIIQESLEAQSACPASMQSPS